MKDKGAASSHDKLIESEDLKLAAEVSGRIDSNLFEALILNFPDMIHSVDANGTIISANKRICEILGYTHEELMGKNVFSIYADEVVLQAKKGFLQLKKEGMIAGINSKLKTKAGEVVEVELRSISLYDQNGKFKQTFTIMRDIREFNFMKNQLMQQSKLAGIGELASGIMHDIRNPLTLISSYNNHFLKEAIEKNDQAMMRKSQTIIEKAVKKIMNLSDHLRSYSRADIEIREPTKVNDIVENSILMLQQRTNEANVTVVNKIANKDLSVLVNENQIEQVIINFIANASDAVHEGNAENKKIEVDAIELGDEVLISVQDFGPGIPKDIIDKIFSSFFTTKTKGKGTGLGLSICNGVARNHGGQIKVESELGKGARFTLHLPKKKV